MRTVPYHLRQATLSDIPFLVDVIVAAEKSGSSILSLCTLFGIDEAEARSLMAQMLDEEIDGCEYSVSSFLMIEQQGRPVAAFGGWLENVPGTLPSGVLKSNLMSFTFGLEKILRLKEKAAIISPILIPREAGTLQLEYLFVDDAHRGQGLADRLVNGLIDTAMKGEYPPQKAQVQLYSNNGPAFKVYERCGFRPAHTATAGDARILTYLPHNEKTLMEKTLN